jgi:aryl-alcohol dehydrogenase-like predicted oxidoreductase
MRYKILGRHTGLRVSELALGAGMFGTRWGHGADRDESRRVFDGYVEAGGNFLDTSDSYQFGESETLLGEFIKTTRNDLVVAVAGCFTPRTRRKRPPSSTCWRRSQKRRVRTQAASPSPGSAPKALLRSSDLAAALSSTTTSPPSMFR